MEIVDEPIDGIVSVSNGNTGKIYDSKDNCVSDEERIITCNLVTGEAVVYTGVNYETDNIEFNNLPLRYEA